MTRPAPSGAKEQVARLLTLVPYLHAKGTGAVRLDEASRDLGVPANQLVKDLRVLFMCGLPGGYPDDLIDVDIDALVDPEGDRVIRVSNADYLARPLRLTPTEATAVIVALRALRSGAVSEETRDVVDRALAKLEQAAAEGAAASRVDPGEDAVDPGLARLRADLQRAVADRRQVRISYWVPSRDEESERVVDPRGVVSHRGVDYLDAWCHSAEAPRSFRLDRIGSVEVLDSPVATPPAAPRDLSDGFFTTGHDVMVVTLRVAPEARWVTEYYSAVDVRPLPDGGVEVDLHVADERWLIRLLMRLAPYAEVVGHPEFTERFAETAARALSLYGADA
ncbi:WYL domain-containing protein [Nocardioides sp. KR10-350]|uniref:helix-turn-helix transcriptional regulator n=1 Tax=Nocardioides cheoyonin TaxID=3156615 RepID=UPI0032B38CB5